VSGVDEEHEPVVVLVAFVPRAQLNSNQPPGHPAYRQPGTWRSTGRAPGGRKARLGPGWFH